jgi:hypothetical protein
MGQTARKAGLDRLYHYQKFDPGYLKDTLINQRVHCSDPGKLNDPWDCRPWFDDEALDDPKDVDALIELFFSIVPASPISEGTVRATKNEIRTNKEYRREILKRFSTDFLTMIPGRWRLYCLTPFPDSTLMWSHYAENHKGVCLEFALDHPVFGSAQEVIYLSSYPKWAPQSLVDPAAPHVLLTKSDDWQYEHEYRIICLGDSVSRAFGPHPLLLSGTFLRLPERALQAVIAGCEADFEEIKSLVDASRPGLKVKRAARARTKYRLEIIEQE